MLRASLVTLLHGCAHAPPPPPQRVGESHKPYTGLPEYMEPLPSPPPPPPLSLGGAAPVVGTAWRPTATLMEEVRAKLAQIDLSMVDLIEHDGADASAALHDTQPLAWELSSEASELSKLLAERSDLQAEVRELLAIAADLPTARPLERSKALRRVGELTDLLRLQLSVTSEVRRPS